MPYTNFINHSEENLKLLSNTLRTLSIDMIEKAGSGHPGTPLGIADVITVLFTKFIKFDVKNPKWNNRDRFILSAGHASAILYALFYVLGYEDITLEDLKNFRQLHSKTAGHPEYGFLKAIEVTTGPLGQGVANGVGIAIAEQILRTRGTNINHKTFVLAGDGCYMEGVTQEAMALAGHLGLSNLIYIYDKNNITIDGKLSLAESTDFIKRFSAIGFNVFEADGHNFNAIEASFNLALNTNNGKPSIIIFETKIGYKSPNKEGSEKSHGSPLGKDEILLVKKALGLEFEPFFVKEEALKLWRAVGESLQSNDENIILPEFKEKEIKEIFAEIKDEFTKMRDEKATRQHSAFVLSKIAEKFPNLIGGSADLSESNGSKVKHSKAITKQDFTGNFIHYGIREHAMGAIMNGIALHGSFKAYGSTFLVFADYMRPPIRLASIMKLPVIYIFTHDSIALGEDGPTHQPIEHLTSLRIIPNLQVFRPADGIETIESLELAMLSTTSPSVIVLSRQKVKECTPERTTNFTQKGAYIAFNQEGAEIGLFATGSEVSTCFEVKDLLEKRGIKVSIISIPNLELFEKQPEEYKFQILNFKRRIFVEAGILGLFAKYKRENDLFFGLETFGESGKPEDVIKYFGLDSVNIANKISSL
jgi:transketolase